MKTLLTSTALAALLAASPTIMTDANAQSSTQTQADSAQSTQNNAQAPASGDSLGAKQKLGEDTPDSSASAETGTSASGETDSMAESDSATGDQTGDSGASATADSGTSASTDSTADSGAEKPDVSADAGDSAEAKSTDTAGLQFIQKQQETEWLASQMIGRSVQNSSGEALGDINDVVLDEQGKVVGIVIGVGGFLGLGEKAVAVNYDALSFKPAASAIDEGTGGSSTQLKDSTGTGSSGQSAQSEPAAQDDTDRSNMVIVLNATTDQLENAPTFNEPEETAEAQPTDSGNTASSESAEPAKKSDKTY